MALYIGCDAHRKFSVFVSVDHKNREPAPQRIEHDPEASQSYLEALPVGSEVALEASGSWYWLVSLMEACGLVVQLANPLEAKKRMRRSKTDALDARGLAYPPRDGRLPENWTPRAELLDLRGADAIAAGSAAKTKQSEVPGGGSIESPRAEGEPGLRAGVVRRSGTCRVKHDDPALTEIHAPSHAGQMAGDRPDGEADLHVGRLPPAAAS